MHYTEFYSEIKKIRPATIRSVARHYALTALSIADRFRGSVDALKKPRVQFLYLHHTFRDEEEQLRALLQRLGRHHTWISYSDAVDKVLNAGIDKAYVCISSDDGFKNNLRAAKICSEFGVSACFFINPALIGETDVQKVRAHCRERLHLPPVEFLNWDDIDLMQKAGHEIGSHTMDHMNIAEADAIKVEEDMFLTHDEITRRCGHVRHFAFPYGRYWHFTPAARTACFNAGFHSCATAERGCHVNHDGALLPRDLSIRRDHVVLDWNLSHILYFLAKNARNATTDNNLYPQNWPAER